MQLVPVIRQCALACWMFTCTGTCRYNLTNRLDRTIIIWFGCNHVAFSSWAPSPGEVPASRLTNKRQQQRQQQQQHETCFINFLQTYRTSLTLISRLLICSFSRLNKLQHPVSEKSRGRPQEDELLEQHRKLLLSIILTY